MINSDITNFTNQIFTDGGSLFSDIFPLLLSAFALILGIIAILWFISALINAGKQAIKYKKGRY